MKNAPYGIVGNGRMATHFARYLELENIPFIQWNRVEDKVPPSEKLSECSTILLLISDDSIDFFIENHEEIQSKRLIHFSGSLDTDWAIGYHPLMTFSRELYDLEKYRSIPFIGSNSQPDFKEIFPGLQNSYHTIDSDQKALYHALCVLSGNFTTLLWQKAGKDFEERLSLPKELLYPYLDQVTSNIKENMETALTGPIKREDRETMERNKEALGSKRWKKIYKHFNKAYQEELK